MYSQYDSELQKIVIVVPMWMKDYIKAYCRHNRISVSQLVRLFFSELRVEHPELPLAARIKHWSGRIAVFFNNHPKENNIEREFQRYCQKR